MAFNIEEFRKKGLTGGGARPSLFEVEITSFPFNVNPTVSEKFKFTCSASEIPAATIGAIDVGYFGRQIKLAGDRTFADWTVTIQNDEDFAVRAVFEAWSNQINQLVANKQQSIIGGNNNYKASSAFVRQFGRSGKDNILREYEFVGIFPLTIGSMALDWDATNRIQTFDVTFSYDYWVLTLQNGTNITAVNPGFTS
jgi:hypothetical protein